MNKAELVSAMAKKAGMTKLDTAKALNAFVDVVKEEIKKGEKVSLVGFANFETVTRPAHECRNPKTGKTIKVAAKKVAKFKPAKSLL